MISVSHSLPVRTLLLGGPTAVGKSEVALLLAERAGGEIISADSMQVYRGLDIGTGKPVPADRARVSQHLIDIVSLTQSFSAAEFVQLARQAAKQIHARGHLPIVCGGTGLYFKGLTEGLGEAPAPDPALRAELEATPQAVLLAELANADPATYARIDRQNPRRVIRAIEVIRLTGKASSAQRSDWIDPARAQPPTRIFGLSRSPEDLRRRIDARVEDMFRRGLVAETEQLLQLGLAQNRTAMQALGYRQVVEHLRGERSLAATVELVKIRTRQFAKRQMTWFRNQLAVEWIPLETGESALQAAARLERKAAQKGLPLFSTEQPITRAEAG